MALPSEKLKEQDHQRDSTGAHSEPGGTLAGGVPARGEPIEGLEGGAGIPPDTETPGGWSPAGGTTGDLGHGLGSGMPGSGQQGNPPPGNVLAEPPGMPLGPGSAIGTGGRGNDMKPLGGGLPGDDRVYTGGADENDFAGVPDGGHEYGHGGGPAGMTGLSGIPYTETPGADDEAEDEKL